jgi:hypothetical protein
VSRKVTVREFVVRTSFYRCSYKRLYEIRDMCGVCGHYDVVGMFPSEDMAKVVAQLLEAHRTNHPMDPVFDRDGVGA